MKKFIDLAKKRQNVSQNELGNMIGISKGRMSQIANGGVTTDEVLIKLARLSGRNIDEVKAHYEMSQPIPVEMKKMWERISSQVAMLAIVSTNALFLLPQIHEYIYYVK